MATIMKSAARKIKMWQVDAFTDTAFTGNPAAVCLMETILPDYTLQKIAAENNLAETAFVYPHVEDSEAAGDKLALFRTQAFFDLRWFTPTREVDLCGHATLASAAVLIGELKNPSETTTFNTRSGPIEVKNVTLPNATQLQIQMSLPYLQPADELPSGALSDAFLEVFRPLQVCKVRFCSSIKYLMVILSPGTTRHQLESLQPNMGEMERCFPRGVVTGVILTLSSGQAGVDIISRFFAPWAGIPEDPVTGSAHAVLGPHFADLLKKTSLTAVQCSARSGKLQVDVDADKGHVLVTGSTVTTVEGTLFVPVEP